MMATLKKTADGKVDKRTTEYKELVERAKKARRAKAKIAKATATKTTTAKTTSASKPTASKTTTTKPTATKSTASSLRKRNDGKVDLRTKEGKVVAQRMAKARASKGKETEPQSGILNMLKKLLK